MALQKDNVIKLGDLIKDTEDKLIAICGNVNTQVG